MSAQTERHILLTGATGTVGSVVLGELLKDPLVRIYLLLRAPSEDQARDRILPILTFLGVNASDANLWKDRLRVEKGDITQPRLGMNPDRYDAWTREVGYVIHAAGNVRLNQSLTDARRDAVDSIRQVLEFIRQCAAHGSFQKLDHLSTVGVSGRRDSFVPEQPMSHPRVFRNTYEAAKAEGEDLVWQAMQKGLPATIHRPSMVVGDSQTGRALHFQIFYYVIDILAGIKTWGIVPQTGNVQLDIIPSDYVARALVLSSQDPAAIGKIFHLCTGPAGTLTLAALAQRYRKILEQRGDKLPSLRPISSTLMNRVIRGVASFSPSSLKRMLLSIPFMLSYLECVLEFDNTEAQRFFSARGLHVPAVDTYLERIVTHYLIHRKKP